LDQCWIGLTDEPSGSTKASPSKAHILLAGLALLIYALVVRQPSIGLSDSSHRGDDPTSSGGELRPPLPRYPPLSSSTITDALQRFRLIDAQGGRLGDAFTRQQMESSL